MAYPNPIQINITTDTDYSITCMANAAFSQQVTIKDMNGNVQGVFVGKGEGVQMQLAEGGDHLGGATRGGKYWLTAYFETDAGSGMQPSTVKVNSTVNTGNGSITTIAAEDSVDNDNNDSVLTVVQTSL